MAIAFKASVTGDKALQAKLKTLAKKTGTKACRAGVNAGSKIILKAAKANLKAWGNKGRKGRSPLQKSLGRKLYVKKGVAVAIVGPRVGYADPVTKQDPIKISHFVEKGRGIVRAGTKSRLGKLRTTDRGDRLRGPRVVTKTGKKSLRFFIGGRLIFARSVKPARGTPFMEPALNRNRHEVTTASAAATWAVIEKDAKA